MCWCVSMSVYVCEWCTLLHYAALARTLPIFFLPWFYLTTKKHIVKRVPAPDAHRLSSPPQP